MKTLAVLWAHSVESPSKESSVTGSAEQPVTITPITLDLSRVDQSNLEYFEYTHDDNLTQLIVPKKGVTVAKIVRGGDTVWTPEENEKFGYVDAYLNKDKKPELILVVTTSSGASKETYLELKNGRWESCNNIEERMKGLRTSADYISTFDIDLASTSDTDKCTIFEVDLLGVTTKHLFPKPGLVATQVKDGDEELWSTSDRSNRCLSCLVYKNGTEEILEITVVENLSRRWKFFERSGEAWKSITWNDFFKKLKIVAGSNSPPHNPSTPSQ
ncbi:hypothetical protein BEWA_054890 [Theileria equi strain WA]|uniref:Signal peptide containing protein n=1 Tax=Theileria equi strain WA TaxID=1537102 RepID=L1LDB2_THEEQ|nr:hypothetical protein BEWA_054890 [Theileria equi strain WA]EKX73432.1 hypothetical protein BEWA_054890 [Theileria equi strain WA]|eukprot:XP_004832884.1 hypothetical protein BEWA_054890 [Theileria equi strain WA]